MTTYKATIVINRPVADVFRFVGTDYFENHPKWAPHVVELHMDSPGVMAVGMRGHVTRKDGSRNVEYAFEVSEYQLNKRIVIKAAGGPAQFSASYEMTPILGDQTQLDIEFAMKLKGLLGLVQPFMAGSLRKEVDRVCRSIKGILEQ